MLACVVFNGSQSFQHELKLDLELKVFECLGGQVDLLPDGLHLIVIAVDLVTLNRGVTLFMAMLHFRC